MQQKLKLTNFRQCLDIFQADNNNSKNNKDSYSKIRRRIAVTWTGWQWSEYEYQYESTVIVRRVFGSIVRALEKLSAGSFSKEEEGTAHWQCCASSAWATFHQPTTPKGPQLVQLFAFSCSLFLALFGLLELETHISGGREKEEVQEEVEHTGRFYFCADLRLLVFKVKLSPSSSLLVVVLVSKWPIRKSWYSIEILKSLVRHIRSPNCCTLIVWHNWRKPCEYASHDYII